MLKVKSPDVQVANHRVCSKTSGNGNRDCPIAKTLIIYLRFGSDSQFFSTVPAEIVAETIPSVGSIVAPRRADRDLGDSGSVEVPKSAPDAR